VGEGVHNLPCTQPWTTAEGVLPSATGRCEVLIGSDADPLQVRAAARSGALAQCIGQEDGSGSGEALRACGGGKGGQQVTSMDGSYVTD
jgi:hypothetical protein